MLKKTFVTAKLVIILLLIGILLIAGISCGDNGPLTVGKLKAKGSSVYDQEIRLSGKLSPGSIDWNAQNGILRFILTDGKDSLNIVYQGTDSEKMSVMLVPNVDLMLTGNYTATGIFNVDSVDREEIPYCQSCHKS